MAHHRDVEFDAGGVTLRGWMRTPGGTGPYPAVILAHGMGGLKEWTLPDVADAFVEAGFVALAFDYRNFGDSGGTPREEVDHCGQIEDWRSAITFVGLQPDVDSGRIGLWGTSLGGRNALLVAALDRRIGCVVAQVPPIGNTPQEVSYMVTGGDLDAFYRELAEDRRDRMLGKEPKYLTFATDDYSSDHGEYWKTFGEAERRNWVPRHSLRSYEPNLTFDIMPFMKSISPTPLLMLIADNDAMCSTERQKQAFEAVGEPKKLMVFEGHHYSLYTTKKVEAIAAARDWFVQYLN